MIDNKQMGRECVYPGVPRESENKKSESENEKNERGKKKLRNDR